MAASVKKAKTKFLLSMMAKVLKKGNWKNSAYPEKTMELVLDMAAKWAEDKNCCPLCSVRRTGEELSDGRIQRVLELD
jgi:hypothetical protein